MDVKERWDRRGMEREEDGAGGRTDGWSGMRSRRTDDDTPVAT